MRDSANRSFRNRESVKKSVVNTPPSRDIISWCRSFSLDSASWFFNTSQLFRHARIHLTSASLSVRLVVALVARLVITSPFLSEGYISHGHPFADPFFSVPVLEYRERLQTYVDTTRLCDFLWSILLVREFAVRAENGFSSRLTIPKRNTWLPLVADRGEFFFIGKEVIKCKICCKFYCNFLIFTIFTWVLYNKIIHKQNMHWEKWLN